VEYHAFFRLKRKEHTLSRPSIDKVGSTADSRSVGAQPVSSLSRG